MNTYNVGVLVGSLRRESNSRKLAQALPGLAPAGLSLQELAFGDLPLYNADLEADSPAPWLRFRSAVQASDALLFIVPEYNRSLPGGLKNAFDVASKPNGKNCWPGKPTFVISQSTGALGGLAGAYALKQVIAGTGALNLPHPEIYLSRIATLFDGEGRLATETQDLLRGALVSFEAWIERFVPRRQP